MSRLQVLQGMSAKKSTHQYLSPEVDSILELSNCYLDVTTQIAHVFRSKVKMPTPILETDPDCLHTCSMSPYQAVDERLVCFFVDNLDLLRLNYSKKYGKKHI